jgi:hypothetical protein
MIPGMVGKNIGAWVKDLRVGLLNGVTPVGATQPVEMAAALRRIRLQEEGDRVSLQVAELRNKGEE